MDNERFNIFFDVDGVVCDCYSWKGREDRPAKEFAEDGEHFFKKASVDAMNVILDYYDADVCCVSSWNSKFKDEEHFKAFLISRGLHIRGLTIGKHHDRYKFVADMIKEHNLKHYLIIDDEAHSYYTQMQPNGIIEYKRILQPNRYRCLDHYDALMVTFNWKLNS